MDPLLLDVDEPNRLRLGLEERPLAQGAVEVEPGLINGPLVKGPHLDVWLLAVVTEESWLALYALRRVLFAAFEMSTTNMHLHRRPHEGHAVVVGGR